MPRRPTTRTDVGVTSSSASCGIASGLMAAGCNVVTVRRAMPRIGHDNPRHLWPTVEDKTRAAASGMAAAVLATSLPHREAH
jgi:hypothetical protein